MNKSNKGVNGSQYREAYSRLGSYASVAREFGVDESTVRKAVARDPAVARGMDHLGMQVQPGIAWIKTRPTEDEPGYSFMVKVGEEDVLDRIRAAFDGLEAAEPVRPPSYAARNLLTVYPVADAHIGMMSWGRETGEDYDTATACARVREWVGRCVASSPAAHTAIILGVGDLLHSDDQTNQTPRSKHALDVDTRHF